MHVHGSAWGWIAIAAALISSSCATSAPTLAAARPVTAPPPSGKPRPTISLSHGTAEERATSAQLGRLFDAYDLSPWLYTRALVVDQESTPHSHPVLTLHTRHLRDDLLLLSTYVHEQSHWYLDARPAETAAAVAELERLAPGLPVGFPDGAQSVASSYEHLIVIALEERALQKLVGELAANQAMLFWSNDHYRVLYRTVLEKRGAIRDIMKRHGFASPD